MTSSSQLSGANAANADNADNAGNTDNVRNVEQDAARATVHVDGASPDSPLADGSPAEAEAQVSAAVRRAMSAIQAGGGR